MPITSLDLQIGRRIRERRWLLGLSQEKLARRVGLKFQQIQKYETGGAKVSAGRLAARSRYSPCRPSENSTYLRNA